MKLEPFNEKRRENKSGHTGVRYDSRTDKYQAYITINGKLKRLGSHATKEQAIRAYAEARQRLEAEVSSADVVDLQHGI
jgi:hypothetical protein